jgi:GNAT superfamily N-acetyltransferase
LSEGRPKTNFAAEKRFDGKLCVVINWVISYINLSLTDQQAAMPTYRLQPATAAHQNEIKALVRVGRINPLGLDWRRFVVALDENDIVVGCGQIKPHRDGSWELASIVVAPAWRGQGVARAIIERLLADSPRPLWLTCVAPLTPFYAQFNFRELTTPADMPPYFRWVSRLFRLLTRLWPTNSLAVMRYEPKT